jgi:hypothetical protein
VGGFRILCDTLAGEPAMRALRLFRYESKIDSALLGREFQPAKKGDT